MPDMLQYADNAQHTFSSKNAPTLHHAIPTLEALFRAWSIWAVCLKYHPFTLVLHAIVGSKSVAMFGSFGLLVM